MKIGIVAGEASGDLLGSSLIKALRAYYPELQFAGIAGPRMEGCGARSWYPMEKLAVRGYVEVLKSYREILSIRNQLIQGFLVDPPDVFIGIDAPDFNLALETALKKNGIPTIHYVSPSIWAWRGERINKIAKAASKVLTLFPFEAPIYQKAGIPVDYVGHPLADSIPDIPNRVAAREQIRLSHDRPVIALLPGSRQTELDYHADLFIETAREILKVVPEAQFVVPLTSRETRKQFESALYRQAALQLPIKVLFGHAQLALTAADVALVASGTATLETALLKCPMVITYRMSGLTYRIMKRQGYLPYVGLPNILAGEFIVPEFLQDDATPKNLARSLVNLLKHETIRKRMVTRFADIHHSLKMDNDARVVEAILPFLKHNHAQSQRNLTSARA
ncbi:MAG: lipid-A-disaccharide synthase [Pseudomonadota bacterium]